ncbi:MAG TPA: MarR family winged helix-turn-helix transcriptional regulator [Ktedonobacteraceae bacterium]|nr:MarR family winged helix-turn-helix transcriptional regulator [Ktedonobacteraceae bacterium]
MENLSDQQERERIAQLAAVCVCSNIRRASRAVTNYYDSVLGEVSNLRVSQAILLVIVYLAGPQTMNDLAKMTGLDRTTIGRNLKPLAQQGLLTLTPGDDQRTRIVTLAAPGYEAILRVVPQWERAQAHMVAGMEQEQVAGLLGQLSAVAARAQEV